MSAFEEYLTLGQWLTEEERLALYKYLLKTQKVRYNSSIRKLFAEKSLSTTFANGEIFYSIKKHSISYMARKIGTDENLSEIRSLSLSRFIFINQSRLRKFFAQCEIDVLRNFPIPGTNPLEDRSYGMNVYPFYDLNYYSDGHGRITGFFKKIQAKDDELLEKLLAS
jgi:hypothetical protein